MNRNSVRPCGGGLFQTERSAAVELELDPDVAVHDGFAEPDDVPVESAFRRDVGDLKNEIDAGFHGRASGLM